MTDAPEQTNESIPEARVTPARRSRWVLLIPVAAIVLVVVLLVTFVLKTGPQITIRMADGHGIKSGDLVRCRGIIVGQVEASRLTEDMRGVELTVRLAPEARGIARAGSRFWVVRPQVGLAGIAGLETIAGPRYVAVLPGDGPPQWEFEAVEQPPVIERIDPGALEIKLLADARLGLRAGSPVYYRQVPIGKVLSVGLSSDAASIEARAYIEPAYAALVRENSRFWNISGADVSFGVGGLNVRVDSLETLIAGGISLATPDPPGDKVHTGHRFPLHAEVDEDWLEWRPSLLVGGERLPPGVQPPALLRAELREGRSGLFGGARQTTGWVIPVEGGLVGPADVLNGDDENAVLEIEGRELTPAATGDVQMPALAFLAAEARIGEPIARERFRRMDKAEDCLLITEPQAAAIPIAASRLIPDQGRWLVDRVISLDASLHGAAVVARQDGKIVGVLLLHAGRGMVTPIVETVEQAFESGAEGNP